MKMLRRIVIILLLCLMGVSAWQLYSMWAEYNRGEKTYDALEEYIKVPEDSDGKKSGEAPFPEVDFAELQKINPDVVGWIYGADTHINYPVVQGKDNNYYLHRMFTGEDNRAGSIFLDSTNNKDFSDVHSILYGHHMKNGAMFHDLMEYKNQEYYDKHPSL